MELVALLAVGAVVVAGAMVLNHYLSRNTDNWSEVSADEDDEDLASLIR